MSSLYKVNTSLDINGGDNVITMETDDEISSTEESQFSQCDLCGGNFVTMSDLIAHIKHHLDLHFLCKVCERFFETAHEYEEHILMEAPKKGCKGTQSATNASHIDIRYHECHICSMDFVTSAELQLHSIEHPSGKTLRCRFCDLPQTNQTYVTQHERNCSKNRLKNNNAHKCLLCDESFKKLNILGEHIRTKHKCAVYLQLLVNASVAGQLLGKSLSDLSRTRHLQTMDKPSTGEKNPHNICSLCDHSFTRRSDLGRHIRTIHNCKYYKELLDKADLSGIFVKENEIKTDSLSKATNSVSKPHKPYNETNISNVAHICSLCNHSFTRSSDLRRHIHTIHKFENYRELLHKISVDMAKTGTEILKCPNCVFLSTSHVSMITHFYKTHFSKPENVSNRLAPQNSYSAFAKHQRLRLLDAVSFHCDLCGRKFRQKSDVSAHIQNHVKIPLHCEQCDIVFTTKDDYKRHNFVHHGNKFSCRRCGDVFETLVELESHRLTVHGKGNQHRSKSELWPCQKCGKFFRKEGLKKHMLTVHTKDRKRESYICDFCGQNYLTYLNYFNHLREHKGLKRLACHTCNILFLSEESLERHKQTHPKVSRPYKCRYCDATYRIYNRRKTHENTRHIRNYSKKCPDCGKLFLDSRRLKVHSVVHTKQKRHECTACGMKFTQHSSLNRHKKIHSEDKNHECTECGLKFVQKYSLTRHMLVHSGEKPHKCLQCPQAFRQVFMLTQHVRKQHSSAV